MARVVHFEVHAQNPQRAIDFYTNCLDWSFEKWGPEDYWLIRTGPDDQPGINGGLLPRQGPAPDDVCPVIAFVGTVDVESLDKTISAVQANGGSIAMEKMAVPTVGWLAYFKDTEGNLFGAMQADEAAA